MERSNFIAGLAGVMAIILLMVLVYFYRNFWQALPEITPAATQGQPAALVPSTTLLLPPPNLDQAMRILPEPRSVISLGTYKKNLKPAVVKFSEIESNFTGTWAAYPQLCQTAWYDVSEKVISVAGAGSCALRGMMSPGSGAGASRAPSAMLVLDCRDGNYAGREVWNISQPQPDTLNIRPNGGNAVSLVRCGRQMASN